MKLEAAIKKMEERQKAMNASAAVSEIISGRYAAHMGLFNMAVLANDKEEITRLRSVLHDFLDQILDAAFDVHTHRREIQALVQIVEDD